MNLGYNDFQKKLSSIPEGEPLYNIIKSRTINLAKVKDKEEKKYWREMKQINEIPSIYLPDDESEINTNLGGIINGKRFN